LDLCRKFFWSVVVQALFLHSFLKAGLVGQIAFGGER
jgi:hypothetical protein